MPALHGRLHSNLEWSIGNSVVILAEAGLNKKKIVDKLETLGIYLLMSLLA